MSRGLHWWLCGMAEVWKMSQPPTAEGPGKDAGHLCPKSFSTHSGPGHGMWLPCPFAHCGLLHPAWNHPLASPQARTVPPGALRGLTLYHRTPWLSLPHSPWLCCFSSPGLLVPSAAVTEPRGQALFQGSACISERSTGTLCS